MTVSAVEPLQGSGSVQADLPGSEELWTGWDMPAAWEDSSMMSATEATHSKVSWHEYRETAQNVNIIVASRCRAIGKKVGFTPMLPAGTMA